MRTIRKRGQPPSLTEWRAPRLLDYRGEGMECNYDEMRRNLAVLRDVENGLHTEQGGICAYTGHTISIERRRGIEREIKFHIEHLCPQDFCKEQYGTYGKDADYRNLVACWPWPNCGFDPEYGAVAKKNWPTLENTAAFVSPLRADCSSRFRFDHKGEISPTNANDAAAEATITNLGLRHDRLKELRKQAIYGALNPGGRQIRLSEARKLLRNIERDSQRLNQGERISLRPFCFAIEPAVRKEIRKLEGILGIR